MKIVRVLVLCAIVIPILAISVTAAPGKGSLLDQLGLPTYPGARLNTEIVMPAGALLDKIEDEFGELLAISGLRKVSVATYLIDADIRSDDVLEFYEPHLAVPAWKTLVSAESSGGAMTILVNDKAGMLILGIDPPRKKNRQITLVGLVGTLDVSRILDLSRGDKDRVSAILSKKLSGIPMDVPLSIPPSNSLNIISTKSDITARVSGRNTVKVSPRLGVDSAGEKSRTDDGRLLLELEPKVQVEEISLPANVPVLLELTDGSLNLSAGTGMDEKPFGLSVSAKGAPVRFERFPLISGAHSVESLGANIDLMLSEVRGGSLNVQATGGNITLILPGNASAAVEVSSSSGQIRNLVTQDQPSDGELKFSVGGGRARISLKALGGTVTIKPAE